MRKVLNEFKEFAIKGSVIDLAIGIIIGGAFNGIVNSLVNDIVMPPIGLVLKNVDFSNLYINLSGEEYKNLAEAKAAGAATINYGAFLNTVIVFLITAFVIFLLVKQINRMRRQEEAHPTPTPTAKECPFCYTSISVHATRCPNCTSQLKGD